MLKGKTVKRSIAALVIFAVTMSFVFVSSMFVQAEEINESNPDLTFYFIDSDLENTMYGFPVTPQTGELRKNGEKYEIDTNSMAAWRATDDIAFAYKKYNVGVTSGEYIEATVTLDKALEGSSVHRSATEGIMIRTGLEPESPMAFFGLREGGPCVVYRSQTSAEASVSDQFGAYIKYPVTIKVRKEGMKVTVAYKNYGETKFTEFKAAVPIVGSGPIYVGLAAHSHNPQLENTAFFSDYNVTGIGTLSGDNPGGDDKPDIPDEDITPDPELTDDILIRETFSDRDLYNKPGTDKDGKLQDSRSFPIWTRDFATGSSLLNENGNIYWDLSGVSTHNYFGDTKMTDYKVSAKFRYSSDCDPQQNNTFRLYTRHTDVEFYGNADYYAAITKGNILTFAKNQYIADNTDAGVTIMSVNLCDALGNSDFSLYDDAWHTLAIDALDNTFKVYLDDRILIDVIDEDPQSGRPYGNRLSGYRVYANGNVGISTDGAWLAVDDIIVTDIEDPIGGDFDNAIGGNWNDYQPGYTQSYLDKYNGIKFY